MTAPDPAYLERVADECVSLVARQFDQHLDWSLASLGVLDAVCADLLAAGPLSGERLDLWWKLIGAYTGEVLARAYDGEWVASENAHGAPSVSALGVTARPFTIANKILNGEPYKSLASFGRALPVIAEQTRGNPPGEQPVAGP